MTPPWWTAADQAEIDLLWMEFLFALESHEARCGQCRDQREGLEPLRCDEFGNTIMAIVEYREMRSLASYAAGMRQMQAVIDELGLTTPLPEPLPSNVVPIRRAG